MVNENIHMSKNRSETHEAYATAFDTKALRYSYLLTHWLMPHILLTKMTSDFWSRR